MAKPKLSVNFLLGTEGPIQRATGREAETLLALLSAGPKGVTSLEAFRAGWAVRLGAYVFDLRAMGAPIETTREPHDGGNHARYHLNGPVSIITPGAGLNKDA